MNIIEHLQINISENNKIYNIETIQITTIEPHQSSTIEPHQSTTIEPHQGLVRPSGSMELKVNLDIKIHLFLDFGSGSKLFRTCTSGFKYCCCINPSKWKGM